jgi:hypothetical protein
MSLQKGHRLMMLSAIDDIFCHPWGRLMDVVAFALIDKVLYHCLQIRLATEGWRYIALVGQGAVPLIILRAIDSLPINSAFIPLN